MRKRLLALTALVTALVLAGGVAVAGAGGFDFGRFVEEALRSKSMRLYGLNGPLPRSSTSSITAEEANADPRRLATLARSLRARVVTHGVGPGVLDMSALWPSDRNPRWLITCNESGTSDAGLVRINIATGVVETILTGTDSCDPAHRTPWGTILFAEEAGGGPSGGRIYELIDPPTPPTSPSTGPPGPSAAAPARTTSRSGPRSGGSPTRASRSIPTASSTSATSSGP